MRNREVAKVMKISTIGSLWWFMYAELMNDHVAALLHAALFVCCFAWLKLQEATDSV